MSNIRLLELNDGFSIPQVGLAAFRRDSPQETKAIVKEYLSRGVRYFEIAELFCNGHFILEALAEANINRAEVFLSLKLWPKDRTPDVLFDTATQLIKSLNLNYLDLIIVHAPIFVEQRFEQWKTLESLKSMGLANVIGVANISMNELMTVMKNCEKLPYVIQVYYDIDHIELALPKLTFFF